MSDAATANPANAPAQPAPLRLGDKAPDFEANTTHGPIKFSTWANGSWVILFCHPADFTPVCTTEFVGFAKHADAFAKKGVKLHRQLDRQRLQRTSRGCATSRSTTTSRSRFPVIADLDQKVARLYGMVHEPSP